MTRTEIKALIQFHAKVLTNACGVEPCSQDALTAACDRIQELIKKLYDPTTKDS